MLHIGDKVKVIGKCAEGWNNAMDDMVGKVYELEGFDNGYCIVEGFLFYSGELEKVPDINDHKTELENLLHKLADGFHKYEASDKEADFWEPYYKMLEYIERMSS